MEDLFLTLNQPIVLWSLLVGSILLVLVDYFFPVDWPAYLGYILFAVFIGTTIPATPLFSLLAMPVVFVVVLLLHEMVFSKFLTNAPGLERNRESPKTESDSIETRDYSSKGSV